MNKTIAMLIPSVVLFAMALILINHFRSGDQMSAPAEGPSVQAPMQAAVQEPALAPAQSLAQGRVEPGQTGMPYIEQGGQGALAPGQPGVMVETPAGAGLPGEGGPAGSLKAQSAVPSAPGEPRPAPKRMAAKSGSGVAAAAQTKKQESAKGTEKTRPAATPPQAAAPVRARPAATPPQIAAPGRGTPQSDKQTAKAEKDKHVITSAAIKFSGSTAILHLQGDAPIQYKYIVLSNPNRLALDLTGAWSVAAPAVPANRVIEKVRVGRYGEKTRIVLDLKAAPTMHEVVKSGERTIEVRVQ